MNRQNTPMAVKMPVGRQLDQESPFELPSLSSCLLNGIIGLALLACVVAFLILVL